MTFVCIEKRLEKGLFGLCFSALAFRLSACVPDGDPPGRSLDRPAEMAAYHLVSAASAPLHDAEPSPSSSPSPSAEAASPRPSADLPAPGKKLASIAMRTFIYVEPDSRSQKIGYLRAGTLVDRAAESSGDIGCPNGWYRIFPRGFVCQGKSASLDANHPIVRATVRGPKRGEPYPYHYVFSRSPPPPLYVRLPNELEQRRVEGRHKGEAMPLRSLQDIKLLGNTDELTPFFQANEDLPKPFGAEEKVRFSVHRGRANARGAFGIMAQFSWTARRFGLTTELDLIPLDRTRAAPLSEMAGLELKSAGVPAFVMHRGLKSLRPDEKGILKPSEWVSFRSGWELTGRSSDGTNILVNSPPPSSKSGDTPGVYVETTIGLWLPLQSLRLGELGQDLWAYAKRGRKWIDVSIGRQMLIAYEGEKPVFATLVSTGRGGTGDPQTTSATVQGTFFVQTKHLTATMDGSEADVNAIELHDVPYVQYFHQNYALHGAYWHDEFGKVRSNGCVNLAPKDAAWLFEWTEPVVSAGWHGAMAPRESGTLIYIHP